MGSVLGAGVPGPRSQRPISFFSDQLCTGILHALEPMECSRQQLVLHAGEEFFVSRVWSAQGKGLAAELVSLPLSPTKADELHLYSVGQRRRQRRRQR
mmetsp:Transcript_21430/g.47606  ORF Transcript_21430/g.47606 Transcript_21430/m.47606 type:complete len:98 (+) Transcript_21430:192-485(+)